METVYTDDLIEVSFDASRSFLTYNWSSASEFISDEKYMQTVEKLVSYFSALGPKKVLGNTQELLYTVPIELQGWTAETFGKELIAGGVEMICIVLPSELFATLATEQTINEAKSKGLDNHFALNYVGDVQSGMKWLSL